MRETLAAMGGSRLPIHAKQAALPQIAAAKHHRDPP